MFQKKFLLKYIIEYYKKTVQPQIHVNLICVTADSCKYNTGKKSKKRPSLYFFCSNIQYKR